MSSNPLTARTPSLSEPRLILSFGDIAAAYDVLICDVWGVIHDGIRAFPAACSALKRFRAHGGTVILVSNAPRPASSVAPQLDEFGAPHDCWDDMVTSGDVSRGEIRARTGQLCYHLGPERDLPVFEGLDVQLSRPESADYIVCTGFFDDETETPEDYRAQLTALADRKIDFICGNPDLVVERGSRMIPCAGALGLLYEELGGRVIYAGKPHRPIYEEALGRAAVLRGGPTAPSRVLSIGDAIRTDIAGAHLMGFGSLLVARGIHAHEISPMGEPLSAEALSHWLVGQTHAPDAIIDRLIWE